MRPAWRVWSEHDALHRFRDNDPSDEGMKRLNAYADGGYRWFATNPDQRSEFAVAFLPEYIMPISVPPMPNHWRRSEPDQGSFGNSR